MAAGTTPEPSAVSARSRLRDWGEAALGLFFPEVCGVCGTHRATAAEGYLCGRCREFPGHLRRVLPPWCDRCGLPFPGAITQAFVCDNCRDADLKFDRARAALVATPFLLDLIHRYKYGGATWLEPFLGDTLVEAARQALHRQTWSGVVPVPLHPRRQRERDFNQAERLAARLALAGEIPLRRGLVQRVTATRTQALLTRVERAKNVAGAFAVRPGEHCQGSWLVVDDVLTTGATTSEVASALRDAGADEVEVWTLARGVWK